MRSDLVIASLLLCLVPGCVDTRLPSGPALSQRASFASGGSTCGQPGQRCTDHNPCTRLDLCDDALRCVGIPIECDDGLSCTREMCHPATGECHYDTWNCGCRGPEDCDDGDPCTLDFCDYERIGCGHEVQVDEACQADNPCHEDATCQPDGTCGGGWNACLD